MRQLEKFFLFSLAVLCSVGFSGCTDNGIGGANVGGTVESAKSITDLRGSMILPSTINADLLASARLSSGTTIVTELTKKAQAYVNGRLFPITIDPKDLSFSIPNVPISNEFYRVELVIGKIGLKAQVKSPDDIMITTRTTAAVLVADKLKENPESVMASYSKSLNTLVQKLEFAFKQDIASFSENVFKSPEVIGEIEYSTNLIKGGGSSAPSGQESGQESVASSAAVFESPVSQPIVSMADPASGASFLVGSDILLFAIATSPEGRIARVSFYEGENKIGEASDTPYVFTWKTPAAGYYTLSVRAVDTQGVSNVSQKVKIRVYMEPSVSIVDPAGTLSFPVGNSKTIRAVASGVPDSWVKVEFYDNAIKLGEALKAPFRFDWTNPGEGQHSLSAKLVLLDSAKKLDNPVVSTPVIVTVIPEANAAPGVSISSPQSDAVYPVGSDIEISAVASDTDGAPVKVEFFVGILKLGECFSEPFTFSWKTPPVGDYAITAKVTDNRGGEAVSGPVPVSVVKQSNLPPSIKLLSPANGDGIPEGNKVKISVEAKDADGLVEKVEFYQGSQKIGENFTPPFSFEWLPPKPGQYTLSAKAIDNKGSMKLSSPVSFSIGKSSNVAPQVTLTSPSNNTMFKSGSDVLLTATATDSDGVVKKVEFYLNSTKLGETTAAPFKFLYKAIPEGSFKISAVAYDDSGSAMMSDEALVIVTKTGF